MAAFRAQWRQAGPWLAIATAPASLMLGGGVAQEVGLAVAPRAILGGAAVLWALSTLMGRLGVRHRRPLVALARPVLGCKVARWSNTVLVAVLMMGWFGFGVGVAGESLAALLGMPEWLAFAFWSFALMGGLWGGIQRGSLVALSSSLATLALMSWGVWQAQSLAEPLRAAPAPGTVWSGLGLVVGYGSAFSLRCVDFTQTMPNVRNVALTALLGLALPVAVVSGAGAWLYGATGTWDLGLLLTRLGFPSLTHAFVLVGFLGAGLTNMFSGGLALQDLLGRGGRASLALVSLVGLALALLDFEQAMVGWLGFLSAIVVPLIGVILSHYALGLDSEGALHWPGPLAWALGALAGLATPAAWPGVLVGVVTAGAAYPLLCRLQAWWVLTKGSDVA